MDGWIWQDIEPLRQRDRNERRVKLAAQLIPSLIAARVGLSADGKEIVTAELVAAALEIADGLINKTFGHGSEP